MSRLLLGRYQLADELGERLREERAAERLHSGCLVDELLIGAVGVDNTEVIYEDWSAAASF